MAAVTLFHCETTMAAVSNDNHTDNNNTAQPSSSPEHVPTFEPTLRILCLHDAKSNAHELFQQLEPLGDRLLENHAIEFVYINGPLVVSSDNDSEGLVDEENTQRVWWEDGSTTTTTEILSKPTSTSTTTQEESGTTRSYPGLDASLLLLRQVWSSMPFWGILAVGKGAAVGSFLPLLGLASPPQVFLTIRGESLLPDEVPLVDGIVGEEGLGGGSGDTSLACLHLFSKEPSDVSQRLAVQFPGQVYTGVSSKKALTKQTLNHLGRFLVEQKRTLQTTQEAANVLVLQNHLFLAEQEAARIVAEQIAVDPPKALTAVIAPQAMAGWSGPKRKAPEGGGAPCPPEFLLKREARTQTNDGKEGDNGPSREHPNGTTRTTTTTGV
eukprot:Nitzschia sp. Nitz4//scaffold82_size85912//76663//77897//NITZ4_005153-RA/size85912-processed-gene-0.18-mRNA-1//1//CDS//3329558871//4023//frame0